MSKVLRLLDYADKFLTFAHEVLLDLRAHNPTMEFKKVRVKQ